MLNTQGISLEITYRTDNWISVNQDKNRNQQEKNFLNQTQF